MISVCNDLPSEINKGIRSAGRPELDAEQFTSWFKTYTVDLLNALPKDINVIRKHKVEFKDWTKTVLISFFIVTSLFILGTVMYGVKTYEKSKETKEMLKKNLTIKEANWLIKFYDEVGYKNPKDTQDFVDTYGEYPEVERN